MREWLGCGIREGAMEPHEWEYTMDTRLLCLGVWRTSLLMRCLRFSFSRAGMAGFLAPSSFLQGDRHSTYDYICLEEGHAIIQSQALPVFIYIFIYYSHSIRTAKQVPMLLLLR
jgi:hypothetical protein